MTKSIRTGPETRQRLLGGALLLAKTVGVTYGPAGRFAMLDRMAGLLTTKDGMTVAREIFLNSPEANMGCQVLKEACLTVNNKVGDGTTTTALLAAELLREGHKMVVAGNGPRDLLRGIQDAAEDVCSYLKTCAVPIKNKQELQQVALTACNGDTEIAKLLAEAAMAVGEDGAIIIEDGVGVESELILKDGMELKVSPVSLAFFTGPTQERVIEGALVAIINAPLSSMADVQDLLESASQWPHNELIVFADMIVGEARATMVLNNSKGVVKSCGFPAPGVGNHRADYLQDICALAKGATFIDPAAGYNHQKWNSEWFGSVRKATITRDKIVLEAYPEAEDPIQTRVHELRGQEETLSSGYDKDQLRERMAKLSGGLALLKIGGVMEAARKERRARVEDALGAVRSALRGGVLPGGGIAYLWGSAFLGKMDLEAPDRTYRAGWKLLGQVLQVPLIKLVSNAGGVGAHVVGKVMEAQKGSPWTGWDFKTGGLRDIRLAPRVMDPAPVVVEVIRAAVSVATLLLTVGTSVYSRGKNE